MATLTPEIEKLMLMQATKFLRAYIECSDEIQAGVRQMVNILSDPGTDEDDLEMTLLTLADALFPKPHEGTLGMDLEESEHLEAEHFETRAAVEQLNQEEQAFAVRLRKVMETQGTTQQQLAEKLQIGQPAISNILNRQCRPQRKTVLRIANALGIAPESLWFDR